MYNGLKEVGYMLSAGVGGFVIGTGEAKMRIREQITLGLRNLSQNPVKRDKALLVARKLKIDLENDQEYARNAL